MQKNEIIEEVNILDGNAKFETLSDKDLKAKIKGKQFIFHFVNDELITVNYKNMIIFADSVKFREGNLFLEQNGGVFVAKITGEKAP